jgi:homoserine dehydrogenase
MSALRIGLLGCGTVGSGVVEILERNQELLLQRSGLRYEIVRVATKDFARARQSGLSADVLTDDVMAVAQADDIDIVVELMGGFEPAKTAVLAALRSGKDVVTANKALLAKHGGELFAAAAEAERTLAFEAAVGGSIPIIRAMKESYVADNLLGVYGIINGTTNFILSSMAETGGEFQDILAEAQKLGYAEADPTFDIEGIDSAHKIALLAMLAYGVRFDYQRIPTEGITRISKADIEFADQLGYKIKLIALARLQGELLDIRVHPAMVRDTSQLAHVNGVFNAVYLEGDNVGPSLLFGKGAGSLPTASAVISDIVAIGRNLGVNRRVPDLGYRHSHVRDVELLPSDEILSAFYIRLMVIDEPGVLGQLTTAFGNHGISIASILQVDASAEENTVPVVLIIHAVREGELRSALVEIERLYCTAGTATSIRILENLS